MKRRLKYDFAHPVELLIWLNPTSLSVRSDYPEITKAARKRILGLFHAVRDTTALLAAAVEIEPRRNYWENPPLAVAEAIDKLQDLLDGYPIGHQVDIGGKHGEFGLDFSQGDGLGRHPEEQAAAYAIIDFAKRNRLSLFRQCICGKWFFARREDQRACAPKCRHKFYEQTDTFKAKRRDYMREYYALKNTGKVK